MKVLVVGSGAREHALVNAIAASPLVKEVLALPGNPGIGVLARLLPGSISVEEILGAAKRESVDLVVIGPEGPLMAGVVDALTDAGILAFGPTKRAALLEGSKSFAKAMMDRSGVRTPLWTSCGDFTPPERWRVDAAKQWVQEYPEEGIVIKADGLAAGKGVVVANTKEDALKAVEDLMSKFGQILIEEKVSGRELSFHAICDGERFIPLPPAQDYKTLLSHGKGPNTGGMGACSPPLFGNQALFEEIGRDVIQPILDAMRADSRPFRGILFAGLMIEAQHGHYGVWTLEFNVRFGDPEATVILPRLAVDIVPYLVAAAKGDLRGLPPISVVPGRKAVSVVIAAPGYPGNPQTGTPITGICYALEFPRVSVLHAGTAMSPSGDLVSAGGRVLCVTTTGGPMTYIRDRCYQAIAEIKLDGCQYRTDIGLR